MAWQDKEKRIGSSKVHFSSCVLCEASLNGPSHSNAERCRSGRTGRSRKPLFLHGNPGFESLSLRHFPPCPVFDLWIGMQWTLVDLHEYPRPPDFCLPSAKSRSPSAKCPREWSCNGGLGQRSCHFGWRLPKKAPIPSSASCASMFSTITPAV